MVAFHAPARPTISGRTFADPNEIPDIATTPTVIDQALGRMVVGNFVVCAVNEGVDVG